MWLHHQANTRHLAATPTVPAVAHRHGARARLHHQYPVAEAQVSSLAHRPAVEAQAPLEEA